MEINRRGFLGVLAACGATFAVPTLIEPPPPALILSHPARRFQRCLLEGTGELVDISLGPSNEGMEEPVTCHRLVLLRPDIKAPLMEAAVSSFGYFRWLASFSGGFHFTPEVPLGVLAPAGAELRLIYREFSEDGRWKRYRTRCIDAEGLRSEALLLPDWSKV